MPKTPDEITDSSNDADAKPIAPEVVTYPNPFTSRKLHEMSDDFVEEYRSGPGTHPWTGQRTHAHKEPTGDE